MIRRSILLLAFLILVFAFVPSCSDGDDDILGFRAAGTIQGLVINVATDEPVMGATITITSVPFVTDQTGTGEMEFVTTTGIDGTFIRNDIANGAITVKLSMDGFVTPDAQYWALTSGGGSSFRFEIAPGEDPIPEFEGDEQEARPGNDDWSDY